MPDPVKRLSGEPRAYRGGRRAASAAQTREAILLAAKRRFEAAGWAATTIAAVAHEAEVSPKTIEAQFGTKAALLAATVEYAIRGDTDDVPMVRRAAARAVEAAADAEAMIDRHIEYFLPIVERVSQLALAVQSAAATDPVVDELWRQLTHNRRFGARWAAETLLSKPGARSGLMADEAAGVFVIAIDFATYRTLAGELALDRPALVRWYRAYEGRMLLS